MPFLGQGIALPREVPGRPPQNENPDATRQTPPSFLNRSLCWSKTAANSGIPFYYRFADSASRARRNSHTEVFHEFPIHRPGQAGDIAHPGGPFELGAVAGAAGA